ncbi:hypothetical protein C5C23_09085 [Rathayibacter rathayi]|nr:hypothetical protein C5C02_09800 [Rathayibacter rathayi]PPG75858.1 hypothetical protein C5C23_09085 [Rathayibacter rathayi]
MAEMRHATSPLAVGFSTRRVPQSGSCRTAGKRWHASTPDGGDAARRIPARSRLLDAARSRERVLSDCRETLARVSRSRPLPGGRVRRARGGARGRGGRGSGRGDGGRWPAR